MSSEAAARDTAIVAAKLPPGLRLAIIGCTTFSRAESEETCIALGRSLAALSDIVRVTGGEVHVAIEGGPGTAHRVTAHSFVDPTESARSALDQPALVARRWFP